MSSGAPAAAAAAGGAPAGEGEGALAAQKCVPCHDKTLQPLSRAEAEVLLTEEVPSWQLVEVGGVLRLGRSWKAKNFLSALEFFNRIAVVAEEEGHHPDLHVEGWNNARVELYTHSIGGLHKNDFIVAAKIDALDVADIMRKPKKTVT